MEDGLPMRGHEVSAPTGETRYRAGRCCSKGLPGQGVERADLGEGGVRRREEGQQPFPQLVRPRLMPMADRAQPDLVVVQGEVGDSDVDRVGRRTRLQPDDDHCCSTASA